MGIKPNKEIIRRIGAMFGCQQCWMQVTDNEITLLVDLDIEKLSAFQQELESWTGQRFIMLSIDNRPELTGPVISQGTLLLPVDPNEAINNMKNRRKALHKKTG